MNWVLILVLVILACSIMNGYRRGMLRIVYSLVSWIIILVFVRWSMPYFNTYIMEHTTLYEKIESHCAEQIQLKAQERAEAETASGAGQLDGLGVSLPDPVLDKLLEKTGSAAEGFLEQSGIYQELAQAFANFVVEGVSFFVSLLCAWMIVQIISHLLGIVSKIPILRGLNQFLGLFAGGIYGMVIIWVGFYIIALCSASEFGGMVLSYIYQDRFLTFLYQNNLVLSILMWFL